MAELPVAVVGLVQFDDRFAIIQRAPGVDDGGYWAPPSGKVEPPETDRDAVIREMVEELGIPVHPDREVWRCTSSSGRYQLRWWLCRAEHRALRPEPTEVAATRWCNRDEFLQLRPTFAGDRRFFAEGLPTLQTD